MMDKDELSLSRYGATYARLSAFGRRAIDSAYDQPTYAATLQDRAEESTLRQALSAREKELENALQEIESLWEQLNETKFELEELRSSFNPPSS